MMSQDKGQWKSQQRLTKKYPRARLFPDHYKKMTFHKTTPLCPTPPKFPIGIGAQWML
jgi:hypothetical protein